MTMVKVKRIFKSNWTLMWICLNLSEYEYVWICLKLSEYVWIYELF